MDSVAELLGTAVSDRLIATMRQQVAIDRRVFTTPEVKAWCARRWRFLFLNEAVQDPFALDYATRRFWDRRSARQRIAEYYLLGAGQPEAAWRDEQPEPTISRIERTTLVACPGLLNGLLPVRDFQAQLPRIEKRFSMRVLRADAHPARGCEANVADLLRALNEGKGLDASGREIPVLSATPPGDVFMIGYSKGAADLLTLLVRHPAVRSRVRCLFSWAGAIGGSEIADKSAGDFRRSRLQQETLALASDAKVFMPAGLKWGKHAIRRVHEFELGRSGTRPHDKSACRIPSREQSPARRPRLADVFFQRRHAIVRSALVATQRLPSTIENRPDQRHAGDQRERVPAYANGHTSWGSARPPLGPSLSEFQETPLAQQHLSPVSQGGSLGGDRYTCCRTWLNRLNLGEASCCATEKSS